ncbi:DUF2572 family protein [Pasteurellaceae bacterium 22721_9_1]
MKNIAKNHRGFVTITLLIALSSLLFLILLFNEEYLNIHRSMVEQRRYFVEQNDLLLMEFEQRKLAACENLALDNSHNVSIVSINDGHELGIQHFLWCKRQALFKQAPKKILNESELNHFIDMELVSLFQGRFSSGDKEIPTSQNYHVVWFNKEQNHWHLDAQINAIVIAEGDLSVTGKGKISGAIITQGNFSKQDSLTISYKKSVVTKLVQDYSRWQYVEKTWHDFIP